MPLALSAQGDVLRHYHGLLAAWHDTSPLDERSFLLNFNDVLSSAWRVADVPGLQAAAPGQFQRMLDAGATESAVLRLLSAESGYMFSRGPDGVYIASVVLAGRETEATASARTGGLAISGAILLSLTDTGSALSSERQVSAVSTSH